MNQPNPSQPNSARPPQVASSPLGFVIAVVGGKGGIGKSVFSANLAVAMALDSKRGPLILDCDVNSTGDINLILGVRQPNGFGDPMMEGKVPDSKRLKALVSPVNTGNPQAPLFAMQMLANQESLANMDPEKIDMAFNLIRKTFPVTIVDCGNTLTDSTMKILDHATLILVPTNPEILVLNQTRKLLEKIQSNLFPTEITKIVVNRVPNNSLYNPKFIEQSLKRQILGVIPEDPASASAALAKGAPYILMAPNSPASKAIMTLSRFIVDRRVLEQLSTAQKPERQKAPEVAAGADGNVIPISKDAGKGVADPRSAFKLRVHAQLVEKMDLKKEELDRNLSEEKKLELRGKAQSIVAEVLNSEQHPWKSREESAKLMKEILDEALALGPLEDYLADKEISEIMVCRADLTYIEKNGRIQKAKTNFSSNVQLRQVIERIVNPIGRRIDEKSPYVDARLADGSRVHAIIPPLAIDGPMLTIRKFPSKRLGPEDLVKFGSMTPEMAAFLRAAVETHANILISGGTGSGKTTLLNVMS
ncbi:Flp pilus assembly complex ATPase component, partial [bacterium]|nr:Flp pilus assembly complex ATPase component [bacterium]